MKNSTNIFDAWFNMINSMTDNWKNMANKWNDEQQDNANDINRMTDKWFENYQEVMGKLWEPYIRQAQQSSLNYFYLNFFNPAVYRTFMDQAISVHRTMDHLSSTRYSMTEQFINTSKTFLSLYDKILPSYDNLSRIYPHTISGWYTEIFRTMQKSSVPFFVHETDGKIADWQYHAKTNEYLVRYYNKASRMQYLLATTAASAWEKLVKEIHSAAREGKPISSFTEFYNEWSKINEKEFVDLFHSKEFVMLQEEILRIQSELVKRFEKNFEFLLQPFPVASKSQMDEVYKTNHDLKTRMNKLEKELAN